MEDLEYAALLRLGFPPSGLLKSEEREGRIQGRRVFFEFVTPPRSSRIRQLRQEKEAIDDIQHQGRNPKTENYRAAAHFY